MRLPFDQNWMDYLAHGFDLAIYQCEKLRCQASANVGRPVIHRGQRGIEREAKVCIVISDNGNVMRDRESMPT